VRKKREKRTERKKKKKATRLFDIPLGGIRLGLVSLSLFFFPFFFFFCPLPKDDNFFFLKCVGV
jgi:hypothetical protein